MQTGIIIWHIWKSCTEVDEGYSFILVRFTIKFIEPATKLRLRLKTDTYICIRNTLFQIRIIEMLIDKNGRLAFRPARYTISFKDPEYTTRIQSAFYKADFIWKAIQKNIGILKC